MKGDKKNPFGKQKKYLGLASDTYDKLVKYVEENEKRGNKIRLDALIDRIIVRWYKKALPNMIKKPKLRPDLKNRDPKYINQIKANRDHAKNFLGYCRKLGYNPAQMLTWLVECFIKKWNIVKRKNLLKKRNKMK